MPKEQSLSENRDLRQRATAPHLFYHIHAAIIQLLSSKAKHISLTQPPTLIPYDILPAFMKTKLSHVHFSKLDRVLPKYWDAQLKFNTIEFIMFVSFKCNYANLTLLISLGETSFKHFPLNNSDNCPDTEMAFLFVSHCPLNHSELHFLTSFYGEYFK